MPRNDAGKPALYHCKRGQVGYKLSAFAPPFVLFQDKGRLSMQGKAHYPIALESAGVAASANLCSRLDRAGAIKELSESHLLANLVTLRLGLWSGRAEHITATVAVAGILLCAYWVLSLILPPFHAFDRLPPILGILVAAYGVTIVSWLAIEHIPLNCGNLLENAENEEVAKAVERWFRSFLSLSPQILTSVLLALLTVPTLWAIQRSNPGMSIKPANYFITFCEIAVVGHGAYCAVRVPHVTRLIWRLRHFRMFWLNPADTPWIRDLARTYDILAAVNASVVSLCMVGLYRYRPFSSRLASTVSLGWLLIGFLIVTYSLLYPHYYIAKLIAAEKRRQLAIIQNNLHPLMARLGNLGDAEVQQVAKLVECNARIAGSPNSALDTKAIAGYFGSLLLPTAFFIAGRVQWKIIASILGV